MSRVDDYIEAAERPNTRLSYASGVRHFEIEWKGLLPATSESIARYLADYAKTLSINTLRQRLAALSRWHADQGFADPTKAPMVRQVLKGIRAVHLVPEKRARPLELDALQQISDWLDRAILEARSQGDQHTLLRQIRDRALLLLGFWRGFRADELAHLQVENIQVVAGEGLTCYLGRSKGDRQFEGRSFHCPALSRLCPVAAYSEWIALAGLAQGPVFRKIDQWGHLADTGLQPNSLVPVLRKLFARAGIVASEGYSSHSLRRGFAGWARASGWDIKDLMEYIGWRDIKSAMRYLDTGSIGLQARFEQGLPPLVRAIDTADAVKPMPVSPTDDAASTLSLSRQPEPAFPAAILVVTLLLTRFNPQARGLTRGRRLIEETCFQRYAMQRLDTAGTRYELTIPFASREILDDTIYALLDEMYRIADDNLCSLEASFHESVTGSYWD